MNVKVHWTNAITTTQTRDKTHH